MPRFTPVPRPETPAPAPTLDYVKRAAREIIDAAETLLPVLAKMQRDGEIVRDHRRHHLISRVETILVDSAIQLTHTLNAT